MTADGLRTRRTGFVDMYGAWLLVVLVVAAVAGGIPLAVDASEKTPEETLQTLKSNQFSQDLPLGRRFNYRKPSGGREGDSVGEVTFGHIVSTPTTEGGVLLVTYIVEPSEEDANRAVIGVRSQASESNKNWRLIKREHPRFARPPGRYRIVSVPHVDYPNVCTYTEFYAECYASAGSVLVHAESRLTMADMADRPHVQELLRAAVAHLAEI